VKRPKNRYPLHASHADAVPGRLIPAAMGITVPANRLDTKHNLQV